MSRPTDWYPLIEWGIDPLPGDWELVQEAAARYRRTADSIQRARELLEDVTDSEDGWQSDAGEAFREKATELSDDVFHAYGRYDATANALAGYWPELREAQEESLELRRQAQQAQAELDRLVPRIEAAEDENSETHDQHASLQGQLDSAQAEIQRLRLRLAEVIEDKDVAAQRAADAIGDFIGGDGLTDGFWDRAGAALTQALNLLGALAGQIAMIAGIASLLLCWVPVLGAALGAVAAVATAISLTVNVLQGNWKGVLMDSIGLLTFGIGRVAGVAARAARGRGVYRAANNVRRTTAPGASAAARLSRIRRLTRATPGEALRGYRYAREVTNIARQPLNVFGRSVPLGPLGWGRHAFRNLGPDLAGSLRAPFTGGNPFSRAGDWRQAMNLTDMGAATSARAGSTTAAQRASLFEGVGVGVGAGTAVLTSGDDAIIQPNIPGGWSPQIPFAELPGLSLSMDSPWSQDAAQVGEFSYQESEATVR
ncbi:hypothetical protein [Streptomyces sp. NBRC 109706]|uniref:hypothetical protein n=1 Tax=Streptomyces sp. NBRC 109706 TaxID=1550035 RepID=UPI000781D49C|nr:hypothetical protein [Streptomyces sp. NBRC 109706]